LIAVTGAGLVLIILLAALLSSAANQVVHQNSAAPVPSAAAPAASSAAAPAPSPPAPSTMRMPLGTPMIVSQGGQDAATLKVTSVRAFTTPADQYGEPPHHGWFVVAHVTARTDPAFTDGFDINPFDFYAKVGGQHFEMGDGNSMFALPMSEDMMSAVTLGAGERTAGLLVFDVPAPHGQIMYSPNLDGQPLGSWKY
jgi:hypothetical protein